MGMIKKLGRLEFPVNFSLRSFCASADSSEDYHLFATLGHRGAIDQPGIFSFYLKPLRSRQWYRFDRTCVCEADQREAVDELFGGSDFDAARDPVAVMLMY